MPHVVLLAAEQVAVQPGSVVSKVVYRDDVLNVTVFGFSAGEGLSEHQASRAAVVQVLSGRLQFTADGEDLDLGPGFLAPHVAKHAPCAQSHRADGNAAHPPGA